MIEVQKTCTCRQIPTFLGGKNCQSVLRLLKVLKGTHRSDGRPCESDSPQATLQPKFVCPGGRGRPFAGPPLAQELFCSSPARAQAAQQSRLRHFSKKFGDAPQGPARARRPRREGHQARVPGAAAPPGPADGAARPRAGGVVCVQAHGHRDGQGGGGQASAAAFAAGDAV